VVALLFDRSMSGKIARRETRALRGELPEKLPLLVSGRAVKLLAKPIPGVQTAVDFSTVMVMMKNFGVVSTVPEADRSMLMVRIPRQDDTRFAMLDIKSIPAGSMPTFTHSTDA
jgi:hypothetical protein